MFNQLFGEPGSKAACRDFLFIQKTAGGDTMYIIKRRHYGWCCSILYKGRQLPKVTVALEELCLQSRGLGQGDVLVNVTLTPTSYHYVTFFQRNNFTLHNLHNV